MTLYSKFETETSYQYLKRIIEVLNEPVCLLGGWAVYLTVNTRFRESQGRNYLGSRDIDIGFHVDKNLDEGQLRNSAMAKSLTLLEKEGFKLLGFRYYKEIHYETGEELTPEEAKNIPTYNIFSIYVDPIVDTMHPSFGKIFGFTPVDESLLTLVFGERRYRKELNEFNKLLWIPTPEILLATKIKRIPNRTRDEKLVKDICDVYVLCWYSGMNFQKIKNALHDLTSLKKLQKFKECMESEKEVFRKAESAMGIDAETIENVILNLMP